MKLSSLLEGLSFTVVAGDAEIDVNEVVYDSRKVKEGDVFVCITGTVRDSHDFIPDVIAKGAKAIIVEKDVTVDSAVTVIRVESSRRALAFTAAAYYGHPASKLKMVGITGTKGKTTTSYMIQSILEKAGKKVGVIGTIGAVINGVKHKTANTTPESFELQRLFSEMVEAGCEYCVMEVSSQGLKMDRVAGFTFDIGVFTNFSADHIGPNEHASMEEYLYCKSLLFRQCKVGIINRDDEAFEGAIKGHTCEIQTFGFHEDASLKADHLELVRKPGMLGVAFDVTGFMDRHIVTSIPGKFSVYNSLVALMVCKNLGIDEDYMVDALSKIQVRGRVEIVPVSDHFTIMIDYAHNAMSVESLLTTIKAYNPKRIVCVYGCGGNRSKLRRYDMGELCGAMADLSILTCDNPRDEEIEAINEDIKVGLAKSNGKYIEIMDRTEAIHYSMDHAEEGDIIILLGKGHEDYQEIKGKKYHYSELEVINEYRSKLKTFA
ncbi:UDP-N-acetylmuramoylalanyl-D-glutamate--2,6-diaminopimelate ligase [Lachnospiraceae bacterium KM106-2]|nr:UDP-N-acetylmuramoylalanyl-D-glutamate--2,6-diaminopimelate ligase [Lachnospiraceae bacterium KM106-2]